MKTTDEFAIPVAAKDQLRRNSIASAVILFTIAFGLVWSVFFALHNDIVGVLIMAILALLNAPLFILLRRGRAQAAKLMWTIIVSVSILIGVLFSRESENIELLALPLMGLSFLLFSPKREKTGLIAGILFPIVLIASVFAFDLVGAAERFFDMAIIDVAPSRAVEFGMQISIALMLMVQMGYFAYLTVVNEDFLERARKQSELGSIAKSEFLANMSHEIRTPMNGVAGMAELLAHSNLSKDDRASVDAIRQSADALLQIIDDILDFSKIEAGKLGLSPEPMCLEDEFDSTLRLLDHLARDKRVTLTGYFDPDIPHILNGDALRLRQVLTNLVGNAIKFSSGLEHPGHVNVRATLETVDTDRAWVRFHIEDNGIGISEAKLARLFTAFDQGDTSTTRTYGGTGLGLVISQNLAQLMGGIIEVESEADVGTTFAVNMPFSIKETKNVGQIGPDLTGLDVIVVGTDLDFASDYLRYLGAAGAAIHSLSDLKNNWAAFAQRSQTQPVCIMALDEAALSSAEQAISSAQTEQRDLKVNLAYVVITTRADGKPASQGSAAHVLERQGLTRRELLGAVAQSTGRISNSAGKAKPVLEIDHQTTPPDREHAIAGGRLILIAEDNATNRQVIQRQLAYLGYAADVCEDGAKALSRLQTGEYGLLLTDLHMPKMDGYELTKTLRAREVDLGLERLPIVALTANAMKGEEEYCLALGIDGYLSKPVTLKHLHEKLAEFLPRTEEASLDEPAPVTKQQSVASNGDAPIWNRDTLAEMVGDDPALHKTLLADFIPQSVAIVAEIDAAFAAKDAQKIGALGHKLKSSARYMGAKAMGDVCEALQHSGHAGEWDKITVLVPRLQDLMAQTEREIKHHIGLAPSA
jgi:signal transduction histidine kinase/CheY-like chemotaxis protein/HPt (histidine-containing phosphotransfer) domain-containing protein